MSDPVNILAGLGVFGVLALVVSLLVSRARRDVPPAAVEPPIAEDNAKAAAILARACKEREETTTYRVDPDKDEAELARRRLGK